MKPFILIVLSFLSAPFCHALTDAWGVDVQQHTAVQRTYKQGETWSLQIALRDGIKPLNLTGATARWYWYTNAVDNVWWTNSASVSSPLIGQVTAAWTPAMDVGAPVYYYWLGVWPSGSTSPLWRATGTIRMLSSPGFRPNAQPVPVRTLDFSSITVTNAPWVTASDWSSGSNALASAIINEAALRTASDNSLNSGITNEAALRSASEASIMLAMATNRVTRWYDADADVWWQSTGGTNLTSYRLVPAVTNFTITVLSGNFVSEALYVGMSLTNQFPFDARIEDNPGLIGVWPPGLPDSDWEPGALASVYSDAEYDGVEWRAASPDFPQILVPQNQWSTGTARIDRVIGFITNIVGSYNLPTGDVWKAISTLAGANTLSNANIYGSTTIHNTQPTNLVLRISASNEYLIVEEVLQ